MKYCKFINKYTIEMAPKVLHINGRNISNPKPAVLVGLGYKPLDDSEPMPEPREGYHYIPKYSNRKAAVVRTWEEVADEEGGE